MPGLRHIFDYEDFNACCFSFLKIGFRSAIPAGWYGAETGFVAISIIELQILFRDAVDMRQIRWIIGKLFAVLTKDHELAVIAHCCKSRRCMLVDCSHEFSHFSAVIDARIRSHFFPVLKAVNDIQIKAVEPAADNFVDVIEDNVLPSRFPVFYLEIVWPFGI